MEILCEKRPSQWTQIDSILSKIIKKIHNLKIGGMICSHQQQFQCNYEQQNRMDEWMPNQRNRGHFC